jgi:hypothetical protein
MVATLPGWFRVLASTALAASCLVAVAEPPEAEPAEAIAVAPMTAAATPTIQPAAPRMRTIHRQVSRLPLDREYRSLFIGDAATTAAHEKIRQALGNVPQRGVDELEFKETPLLDVVSRVREVLKVPVILDVKALEDAGIDLETPITFSGQGTTVRAALRRILGDIDLTWTFSDEALLITTRERAGENPQIRLYPVPWGKRTQGAVDFQELIDLIVNTVGGPAAWQDGGGNGSIRPLGDGAAAVLVVSQTAEVHDEIEGLLRGLQERDLAEFGGPHDPPTVRVHHVADEAVRRDLAAKLVELCNASLQPGADAQAKVTMVGDSLTVQSGSPEFHALAGQLIRAVAGEQVPETAGPANPMMGQAVGGGMF